MLLGELADVFRAALGDYHRFGVEPLIRRTIAVLSFKGTPDAYAYPEEAYRLKADAERILSDAHEVLGSAKAAAAFAAPLFGNLMPGDIARQIRSFLTVDIALSAPSTEAQFLLLRFQAGKALMENVVQVANALGFYPFPLPEGRVMLAVRLPTPLFGGDLARLGDLLKILDEFLGDIAEDVTGQRGRPAFHHAGGTDVTLHLSVEPRLALPVMHYVKACLETAKAGLAFEAALVEMRRAEVPAETLDGMTKSHLVTQSAGLARAVEGAPRLREGAGRAGPDGRDASRMVRLCLRLARAMEQGLAIHLMRPLVPASGTLLAAEPLPEGAEAQRLLAEAVVSQAELDAVRRAAPALLG